MTQYLPSGLKWKKSSFSGKETNCVEVAGAGSSVYVRDSKDRGGTVLKVSAASWLAFIADVKNSRASDSC